MKQIRIFALSAVLIFTVAAVEHDRRGAAASSAPQSQQSTPTIASTWTARSAVLKGNWSKLRKPYQKINSTFLLRASTSEGATTRGTHLCRAAQACCLFQLFHMDSAYRDKCPRG